MGELCSLIAEFSPGAPGPASPREIAERLMAPLHRMDIRHFFYRARRLSGQGGATPGLSPTFPPSNLVARQGWRQTRKLLNPA